ncbi:hypothetical protein [Candidatus Hodarchaeum mangrovi]
MENKGLKKKKIQEILENIKKRFSRSVEEEQDDKIALDDIIMSIALVVFGIFIGLYFIIHQVWSTGFFTTTFGTLEFILLYGFLLYWIVTSSFLLFGYKNPSRDLDSFGGLFFATFSIIWLLIVFPFDFTYFADVIPEFFRFLVQWVSNDIIRVLMVFLFIFHLVAAVYSLILRLAVYKARTQKTNV